MDEKRNALVSHRLHKRISQLKLNNFEEYAYLLFNSSEEQQIALNLLTTNETYFFREPKHFEFIAEHLVPEFARLAKTNIWSAASSSGEEVYSLAMMFDDLLPECNWHILGTDINTDILSIARSASYELTPKNKIPERYLKQYCLKGVGDSEGLFKIKDELKQRVCFKHHNLLNKPINNKQKFDLILLRNVLIYFQLEDRKKVVQNVTEQMRHGGWLIVGHSENIHGFDKRLVQKQTGCYQFQP
ncbi:protein-glutamate O-methyltransferase CheR [Vibrio sp. B1FLJ16]|uniref:CheR family methyltransferase n=1 Tax=Vibrio sp. B1FLJ16 TaxID=2751178 RepID=UPI001FD33D3C|nr:protein-glutamate O-methyltransferase CheR [Vibrio sp. B1FLJ16]